MASNRNRVWSRIDRRLIPWLALLVFLSVLDRANIGLIHLAIASDLNFTETQFSIAASIFFVGYILFEIPSNALLKAYTPSKWLARIIFSWGLICSLTAAVQSLGTFILMRILLGIAEAGLNPGITYYITKWYPHDMRTLRLAFIFPAGSIASAFGGVLSYVIMTYMDNLNALDGWRWLLILEGLPSMVAGIATYFLLPDFPETAKMLNSEERAYVLSELDKDRHQQEELASISSGTDPAPNSLSEKRTSLSNEGLIQGSGKEGRSRWSCASLFDFDVRIMGKTLLTPTILTLCITAFFLQCGAIGFFVFLPAILSFHLGVTPLVANLLTAPIYLVSAACAVGVGYSSDKRKEKTLHFTIPVLVAACSLVFHILVSLNLTSSAPIVLDFASASKSPAFWASYSACFMISSSLVSIYPVLHSWLSMELERLYIVLRSQNPTASASVTEHSILGTGTAAMVMFGNTGAVIGTTLMGVLFDKNPTGTPGYWVGEIILCSSLFISGIVATILAKYSRDMLHRIETIESARKKTLAIENS